MTKHRFASGAAAVAMALCAFGASASAQNVKSEVTASNGVSVSVNADEFANRYEYAGPIIEFQGGDGHALVGQINNGSIRGPITVQGFIIYRGDWRFYSSALYRGGASAEFVSTNRDVISCSGSRYGGCSHNEGFIITVSPEDLRSHAQDGKLDIQIRGRTGQSAMLSVPVSHFEAVKERAEAPR